MSTFWTVFIFVMNFAIGIFLVIACNLVGKWCKKLASTDKEWEKAEAESKVSGWLWAVCASIIVTFIIAYAQFGIVFDKEFKTVNDRVETIEKQMALSPTDTLYIIKDLPKDE